MNLDKILAISGKPGLYVLKVQTRTGFVAESLIDGKKITNISNIKAVKLNHFNKNYSLEIELKDNNQIIEKNILDKFIYSIRVFLKSNPLVISRINYVKKNPNDFFLFTANSPITS